MARTPIFVAVALLAIGVSEIDSSADQLKQLTSGFMKVLEECKRELNLSDHIISDLYHYWKEDYSLLNRETGCAIVCMSKKLELLDENGKIHHGNAQEFAAKHGADSDVSSKLIGILHECEKMHDAMEDICMKALEIAKCFRTNIHQLNWAPKMDVIITEVLTDI